MFSAIELPKINTGTDLVVSSNNMMTTTAGAVADVQPMSPMDSLRAVFDDMRYALESIAVNTLETNNLLQRLAPTSAENRDEKINDGETDTQGNDNPPDKGGTGFLDRLGGLNPFKDGLGTFGKFAIAIGALVGLKLFGENLIPSIANLLETIKSGKLTDKIKEIYTTLKVEVLAAFEDIKLGVTQFLEGTKQVYGFIKDIIESINAYVMQFDEDGDGKLDPAEKDALTADIKDKAVGLISDFLSGVFDALKVTIIGGVFLGAAVKALLRTSAVASIFGTAAVGTAGAAVAGPPTAAAAASAAGMGIRGVLGIAGLLAYGITATWSNYSASMEKTLKENEGKFDFSDFMSNFMGGKDKGGVMSAFSQAYKLGGTGALAGAAIGSVIPGVGTIVGGLVGMLAGGLIGAATGYAGSDEMKSMFDNFETMISTTANDIGNFFGDLVRGFKGVASGDGFKKAFTARDEADIVGKTEELKEAENYLADVQEFQAMNPQLAKLEYNQNILKKAQAAVDKLKLEVEEAPEKAKQFKINQIQDDIEKLTKKRDKFQSKINKGNLMPGIDSRFNEGVPFETEVAILNDEIAALNAQKDNINSAQSVNEIISAIDPSKTTSAETTIPNVVEDKVKKAITTNESSPGHPANQNVMANVGNTYQSNVKGGDSFVTGGLSSGDNFMTAVIMAHKKAQMQND